MFRNTFQSGFLSILYSLGSKPLQLWSQEVNGGTVAIVHDTDIRSSAIELMASSPSSSSTPSLSLSLPTDSNTSKTDSTPRNSSGGDKCMNLSRTFISCPPDPSQSLGIKLPVLTLVLKSVHRFVSFEVQVVDDKGSQRRFRASNFQSLARICPAICTLPLRLCEGWNVIQLNLGDLTRRAYASGYKETMRVQVHANCRLRRIFFSDRVYSEEELPPEFKIVIPSHSHISD